MQMILRLCLYGVFGWCAEIVWTAGYGLVQGLRRRESMDVTLAGHTYLWMFPIYGCGGLVFEVVHAAVAGWPWPARGFLYMLGCFGIEYASGWLVERASGKVPWDYSDQTWHVHGLIRLDYAPVWFAFGLILETVERFVRAAAPAIGAVGW